MKNSDFCKPEALFQHYKGNYYRILAIALHCDTQEEMVVYVNTANTNKVWVRSKIEFCEFIEEKGVYRFHSVEFRRNNGS